MDIQSIIIPIAHAAEEAATHSSGAGGIAASFGVDWQHLVAQLINFAVALFILWKWVFTPITKALANRTEKIERSLKDAEQATKDRAEFEKWKAEQIIQTRHEASTIVNKAQADANKVKEDTLQQTKDEQQKLIDSTKKQIEQQKQEAITSAKAELADLVTMATEKIIHKKMDKKSDEEMVKEMLKSM